MEKIISVKNLRKAYKKETAVQNVCFELAPGNIMGLLGTNGAGKTTAMKLPAASCGVSARDSLRSSLVCCAASCGELNPLFD